MDENRSEQNLIVGLDIGKEDTQLACYSVKTGEPLSVGKKGEEEEYLIPTELGETEETLQTASAAQMEQFFRRVLLLLKQKYPYNRIRQMVVTTDVFEQQLVERMMEAFANMGLYRDRIFIQGYRESFLYYTIHQKEELWQNDVALFHLGQEGLLYWQLNIQKKSDPKVATIVEKDYTSVFSASLPLENERAAAAALDEAAGLALHRQIVSTVFAVGKRFDGNWADSVLAGLCKGRRVFKGQNLYAKGACYAACDICNETYGQFLFLGEDTIKATITLNVYADGKKQDVLLARAGDFWYEEDTTIDLILDEKEELLFHMYHIETRQSETKRLLLDGLVERENKMTRIRLFTHFTDPSTFQVEVEDLGFGDYAPPLGLTFQAEYKIE